MALNQNADRYSKGPDGWLVSASPNVPPLVIPYGTPLTPPPLPLLKVDGIIISIDGINIASPKTISDMNLAFESNDPHYSPVSIGPVNGSMIGGTIPVIPITTSGFTAYGELRDFKNRNAGVDSVDYLYEGPQTQGIPDSLLNQINWVLDSGAELPADTFSLWNWKLAGDYSVDVLITATKQSDNFLNRQKLMEFMDGVNSRLKSIREDFNAIKYTFHNGVLPPNNGTTSITRVATTDDDSDHTVLFKDYQPMGMALSGSGV